MARKCTEIRAVVLATKAPLVLHLWLNINECIGGYNQMDFRQTTQSNPGRPAAPAPTSVSAEHGPDKHHFHAEHGFASPKWMRIINAILLLGVAVLLVGISLAFTRQGGTNEFSFVNSSKYQAVFLNNGQVYFGHIGKLNTNYVEVSDVYYLTQGTSANGTQSNNYTLLQLGCQQIHYPDDQMLINRDQVTFWENLNSKGQVVTKINELKKQGVDCSHVSNQTQAPSSTTQGSNSSSSNGSSSNSSSTSGQ